MTVADALAVPPDPVQERLNVLVLVSAAVDSLPPAGGVLAPDQPPEAVQAVAFVEDQVSVEDPPLATDAGFAASDTVCTGGGEGSTAELSALPPPQPESPRLVNRAANANNATFDKTTPRLLMKPVTPESHECTRRR